MKPTLDTVTVNKEDFASGMHIFCTGKMKDYLFAERVKNLQEQWGYATGCISLRTSKKSIKLPL